MLVLLGEGGFFELSMRYQCEEYPEQKDLMCLAAAAHDVPARRGALSRPCWDRWTWEPQTLCLQRTANLFQQLLVQPQKFSLKPSLFLKGIQYLKDFKELGDLYIFWYASIPIQQFEPLVENLTALLTRPEKFLLSAVCSLLLTELRGVTSQTLPSIAQMGVLKFVISERASLPVNPFCMMLWMTPGERSIKSLFVAMHS